MVAWSPMDFMVTSAAGQFFAGLRRQYLFAKLDAEHYIEVRNFFARTTRPSRPATK